MENLTGYSVVILGGDDRELHLANSLVSSGARVYTVGFEKTRYNIKAKAIYTFKDCFDFEDSVDALILPFPGIDANWNLKSKFTNRVINFKDELNSLNLPPLTLVGFAKEELKKFYQDKKAVLIEVGDKDEVAILNSIPTAEGAIALAIENTPFTLDATPVLILGFGRCGKTLTRRLTGLNAEVTVVTRSLADRARVREMGGFSMSMDELRTENLQKYRVVFNTVPQKVLDKEIIGKLSLTSVIIDIASGEGGTDFEAANKRKLNAILAKGLPGKYAPETSGNILSRVYPKLIKSFLGR